MHAYCMFVYMCICIYLFVCMYLWICHSIFLSICVCKFIHVYMYVCVFVSTCTSSGLAIYMLVFTHLNIMYVMFYFGLRSFILTIYLPYRDNIVNILTQYCQSNCQLSQHGNPEFALCPNFLSYGGAKEISLFWLRESFTNEMAFALMCQRILLFFSYYGLGSRHAKVRMVTAHPVIIYVNHMWS